MRTCPGGSDRFTLCANWRLAQLQQPARRRAGHWRALSASCKFERLHEYYPPNTLQRIAPVSLALESTMGWHRSIVGCLVGLLLYASTPASMPLAWCVGAHGHNAIELCAGPTCHQGALLVAARVQSREKAASIEAVSAHGEPCIDRTVMHEQFQAPEVGPPVAAPIVISVPKPFVVEQTSIVHPNRQVPGKLCWRSTAEPLLKSIALRI